ncbi:hypothetical protein ABB37_05754 [Leptomonas pyrrhocoris]|uniref:Uncharacterized protein n=1 Tax=Leptomonas pyrrhocoris TaxID=157538 RepID=A0A0M9FZT1_LEPPY|nr:hypothetical protein ABB37_05754 [Leptomonas pyrrhocoris]KPA79289.1 hypothetical protein ABB37_05754 [Leptomonas pyrrhocoris]|eukprot:XP_015657728.1 hypothetical protein ABB37_05754 [Leptomonas pyrrhocoris]
MILLLYIYIGFSLSATLIFEAFLFFSLSPFFRCPRFCDSLFFFFSPFHQLVLLLLLTRTAFMKRSMLFYSAYRHPDSRYVCCGLCCFLSLSSSFSLPLCLCVCATECVSESFFSSSSLILFLL